MWKIPLPQVSITQLEADLKTALTYKNGTPVYPITAAEKKAILALYELYDRTLGLPSTALKAAHYSADLLEAVKEAYSEMQQGGRLEYLREQLTLPTSLCPYCGFGETRDLDHYLPKSDYFGLAIYPRNLIPCCAICNGKKGTLNDAAPNKQFHHAYFGYLPDVVFFVADIVMRDGALLAEFKIDDSAAIDPDTFERLQFQIRRLELNSRYIAAVNTFLCSLETSLVDAFGDAGNAEVVKDFLERTAESNAKSFGKNDWRAALLRGLAISDEFCNGGFITAVGRLEPMGA